MTKNQPSAKTSNTNNLINSFPNPEIEDIDNICIYNSILNNKNINYLNSITRQFLYKMNNKNIKNVNCSISNKKLIIHNNYPIINGIFILSYRKYNTLNYISISNRKNLYPIHYNVLELLGKDLLNKCKYGRIYKEAVILRFLNSESKNIKNILEEGNKKYKSVRTIEKFYKNVLEKRPKVLCAKNLESFYENKNNVSIENIANMNKKETKNEESTCVIC